MASHPSEPTPSHPGARGRPRFSGSSWPVSPSVGRCIPSLWRWLGRGAERPSRRLRVRQLDCGGGDHGPRHRDDAYLWASRVARLALPRVMSVHPGLVRPCCPLQLPALDHSQGIPSGHGGPRLARFGNSQRGGHDASIRESRACASCAVPLFCDLTTGVHRQLMPLDS